MGSHHFSSRFPWTLQTPLDPQAEAWREDDQRARGPPTDVGAGLVREKA